MSGHKDKLISIVLALYNGEKFLKEQLDSIQTQTCRSWELIVVDDGSTDAGPELARMRAASDGRIHVHAACGRLGITANFLRGVCLASGDYVCFSDQDDVWRADKLEVLKQLIEGRDDTSLVYSDLEVSDSRLNRLYSSFWKSERLNIRRGRIGDVAILRNIMPGCSMLFRKDVAKLAARAGGDAPFRHDHLAFVVAAQLGHIDYTKKRLIQYRQHGDNSVGAVRVPNALFDRAGYLRDLKHKISYLRSTFPELGINYGKLISFCDSLEGRAGSSARISLLPYHLFLKENRVSAKLAAVFQGLFPEIYAALRTGKTANA